MNHWPSKQWYQLVSHSISSTLESAKHYSSAVSSLESLSVPTFRGIDLFPRKFLVSLLEFHTYESACFDGIVTETDGTDNF